jgi:membrane protein
MSASTRTLDFLRLIQLRFREDRCVQVAASLTYTTLLALVPIITIVLTVFSAFPVFADLMTQLKVFILSNLVPASAGKVITVYTQQFSEKAARLTAAGIVALAVTAVLLMLTIEHAFDVIWRVRRSRSLTYRVLIYWAALTLGPLFIGASLSLTSYVVSQSLGLVKGLPFIGLVTLKLVPVVLTIVAFSLLYLVVPNRQVDLRHALIGGVAAGLAFELMKRVFTFYITNVTNYTLVYGAFASFPIFLLWVYFSWLVVLLGAVIAAALPSWESGGWQQQMTAGRRFYGAVRILEALHGAQRTGQGLALRQLRRQVPLGLEHIEDILDELETANWAGRVAGDGWVLTQGAEDIRLADIYRRFVFRPQDVPSERRDPALEELLERLDGVLGEETDLSVAALSRKPTPR